MKLTPEEEQYLLDSDKCTRCGHLVVFHDIMDGYCDIKSCQCLDYTREKGVKPV